MPSAVAYGKLLEQLGAYGFAVVVLASVCAALMGLVGVLIKQLATNFVSQKAYDRVCDDASKVTNAVDILKDAVSENTSATAVLSTLLELSMRTQQGGGQR